MARNYGTERAAGRYVMYVDADDYLSPGVLGRLTQIMDRERLDMLCFDMAGVDEHGGDLPLWSDGLFARGGGEVQSGRDFLRRDCFLPMACAYVYDRTMLERHGLGMLPMRHEDEEFTPARHLLRKTDPICPDPGVQLPAAQRIVHGKLRSEAPLGLCPGDEKA